MLVHYDEFINIPFGRPDDPCSRDVPDTGRRPEEAVDTRRGYGVIVGDYPEHLEVVGIDPESGFVGFWPGVVFFRIQFGKFVKSGVQSRLFAL